MTIKGMITLLDRFGVPVQFEVTGENPKTFNVNKVKKQKEMGIFGYTPVDIPAGGIILPWDNHDNFDWSSIGARKSKATVRTDEGPVEKEVVWFRNQMYTRRDMIGIKVKGQKMPDMIAYSRGAAKTVEDKEKAVGESGGVSEGYIVLVAFKHMKGMPEGFKYPEFDIDNEETKVARVQPRQQVPEQRSYLQLKGLVAGRLKDNGRDSSEEQVKKTILARAKKVIQDKEYKDVLAIRPSDNYKLWLSFGGSEDDSPPVEEKKPEPAKQAKTQQTAKKPQIEPDEDEFDEEFIAETIQKPTKKASKPEPEPELDDDDDDDDFSDLEESPEEEEIEEVKPKKSPKPKDDDDFSDLMDDNDDDDDDYDNDDDDDDDDLI